MEKIVHNKLRARVFRRRILRQEGRPLAFRPPRPTQNRRKVFRRLRQAEVAGRSKLDGVRQGVRQGSGDLPHVGCHLVASQNRKP